MSTGSEPKTIVITGASKGVGRALAIEYSRQGWRVGLIARNEDGLNETHQRLMQNRDIHIVQPCDISIWPECSQAAERIQDHFGYVNVLINNAFGYGEETLEKIAPGNIHDFFAVSVTGTTLITKAFIPALRTGVQKTARKSQIINIVADWGFPMHNVFTGTPTYVAGKYAIHGLGVALHKELAPEGINVTNIYPGIIASDLDIDDPLEKVHEEFENTAIPLKDIATLVVATTELSSSVVRHLVISPDNPSYNGL